MEDVMISIVAIIFPLGLIPLFSVLFEF